MTAPSQLASSACSHWANGGYCGAEPARHYLPGQRCVAHTPAALAGRAEPHGQYPEPFPGAYPFVFRASDTALIDERARKSGKRANAQQRQGARS